MTPRALHVSLLALLVALILAALSSTPLCAQSITVTGVQNLRFGVMIPGVDKIAARTDPAMAAEFQLQTSGNRQVQLTFTLPSAMSGPGGATLPLVFGPTDAGFAEGKPGGTQLAFDPRAPHTDMLRGGRASVYLGATARPAPDQASGSYSATVTLTVILFP